MPSTPQVEYTVRLRPAQHEIDVIMVLRGPAASGTVSLEIPSWVPGAYGFEPYARDLFNLTATDVKSGKTLPVHRENWSGFRVEGATGELKLTYTAYAYAVEFAEPCGIVSTDWAILLGTRYLYSPQARGACRVHYVPPEGWTEIHHPSGAKQVESRTWDYPSHEVLLDTPVVFGQFDRYVRKVGKAQTPFYFVFVDRGIGFAEGVEDFCTKVAKVAEGFGEIFGGFPFTDYTFVLSLNPNADWGLEHLTSTMCGLGPDVFIVPDQNATGVRVCAHELFHAWNVRRLRPSPLKDVDAHLQHCGCFTEGLWVAEGFTRYYEFLASTRAGVYTPEQFFSAVMGYFTHLTMHPAYERVSGVDSSYAVFLNHFKYAGWANDSVDFYDKGMLMAFETDSMLRLETKDQSLDTAFAAFYKKYVDGGEHAGYTTAEVVRFFDGLLPGLGRRLEQGAEHPGGLDVPELFQRLGFKLDVQEQRALGLLFQNDVHATVDDVIDISPAGGSGIAPADVITLVNGFAFSPQALQWAASNAAPVTLTVLRGNMPLEFAMVPKPRPAIKALTWAGTKDQADRIAKWLGQPFAPAAGQVFSLDFYENFHGVEILV